MSFSLVRQANVLRKMRRHREALRGYLELTTLEGAEWTGTTDYVQWRRHGPRPPARGGGQVAFAFAIGNQFCGRPCKIGRPSTFCMGARGA